MQDQDGDEAMTSVPADLMSLMHPAEGESSKPAAESGTKIKHRKAKGPRPPQVKRGQRLRGQKKRRSDKLSKALSYGDKRLSRVQKNTKQKDRRNEGKNLWHNLPTE